MNLEPPWFHENTLRTADEIRERWLAGDVGQKAEMRRVVLKSGAVHMIRFLRLALRDGIWHDDPGSAKQSLTIATRFRNVRAVQLLLEAGADTEKLDCGANWLVDAVVAEGTAAATVTRRQMLVWLLELGAQVNTSQDRGHYTLSRCLQPNLLRLLVAVGAECRYLADAGSFQVISFFRIPYPLPATRAQFNDPRVRILAAKFDDINAIVDLDEEERAKERALINRVQLDLIRERAFEICVALQCMRLPAFVTLQIVDASWDHLAHYVALHLKWKLTTTVKHFCEREQPPPADPRADHLNLIRFVERFRSQNCDMHWLRTMPNAIG